jgi:hypothetical protein
VPAAYANPCVATHDSGVMYCAGAGKSHFAEEVKHKMAGRDFRQSYIDGSDDRLVDMALLDILEQEVSNVSQRQFLVVDEFHMLWEHHKMELFHWLQKHAKRLHVLLIANRKDSRDEELLNTLRESNALGISKSETEKRVVCIQSRLGSANLKIVMEKNKNKFKSHITRWVHCCRYLARCMSCGTAHVYVHTLFQNVAGVCVCILL